MLMDQDKSHENKHPDRENNDFSRKRIDPYLERKLNEYTTWLSERTIAFSSRVIPIQESFEADQWVLPSDQALGILQDARSIAVQNCVCRSRYQRCNHPLNVCFLLNETSDRYVADGLARRIAIPEATEILKIADQAGLVHLTLYMPDHEIFALCSCCSCCCHDFQLVMNYGQTELMVRSDYISHTDFDLCSDCGICVDRCVFGARSLAGSNLLFMPEACMGCGLCVTVCDEKAIRMVAR